MHRVWILGVIVAGLLAMPGAPARAIGCISGGAAGAVAGHMAHHGVLGAIGGCIAGHEYHKHHEQYREDQSRRDEPRDYRPQGDEQRGYDSPRRD